LSRGLDLKDKEIRLSLESVENIKALFGYLDNKVKVIENVFKVEVDLEEEGLVIRAKGEIEEVFLARDFLQELSSFSPQEELSSDDLQKMALSFKENEKAWWNNKVEPTILTTAYHKSVRAKSPGQMNYVQAVRDADITFCIGPAGTGKTYLAMAMACAALQAKEVSRIVLVRPAVEAGESLGYLPGDLKEKIEPYLRPLYDALYEMLSPERFQKYSDKGVIEVAPLAYMRGRTLNDSFIVLDEAQNTTPEQMKMFLTRMGIVTGDITKIDLLNKKDSGLINARNILRNIPSIDFIYFDNKDVVRHKLVADIIKAYEREAKEKEEKK